VGRRRTEDSGGAAEVSEGGGEFGDGDAGGAEFADDDTGGGVGEDGGVGERSACGYGEGEDTEDGVAGTGDVEDLATGGATFDARLADAGVSDFKTGGGNGDVAGRRLLKDAHAFFTASDDHGAATEMREQIAAGFFQGFFVVQGTGDEESGFFGVADNYARAAIGVQAGSLGLYEDGNFEVMASAEHARGKSVGDEAFIVVGEHEAVEFF